MQIEFTGDNAMTFILKELAYQNTAGTQILAGQKFAVGIGEMEANEHDFTLFPNPVKSTLQIQSDSKPDLSALRIYSLDGRCVKEVIKPELPYQLDMSEFDKGVYFVEMIHGESTISRKRLIKAG